MSIESEVFTRFSPNYNKLLQYGFTKNGSSFSIEKMLLNNNFKAVITISETGNISGTVYDLENNDEYLPLRVENQEGSFVGEVRNAYTNILTDIRNKCFSQNYFISNQGNRISNLVFQKFNDKPLFMWEDSPSCGVFKNPISEKWYGIIMHINRTKIGQKSDKMVEVLNLKLDKDKIQELLKREGFYPAYHMNKKYWVTIALDETLHDNEIMRYIQESHSYTVLKKNK